MTLEYYPNYVNALLLKGDVLRTKYLSNKSDITMSQMNEVFTKIYDLGYKNVSQQKSLLWLEELARNIDKYQNKNVNLNTNSK